MVRQTRTFRRNLRATEQRSARDPANIATGISFFTNYTQMLANIMQQLQAVPESDGSTLLDHTIVVWTSELGAPGHQNGYVNYTIGGGGATGTLKTGRYLPDPRTTAMPTSTFNPPFAGISTGGTPHTNLFVSLANAMGINTTTFGDPALCTGPLAGFTG